MQTKTNTQLIRISEIIANLGDTKCSFICNAAIIHFYGSFDAAKGLYVFSSDTNAALNNAFPTIFKSPLENGSSDYLLKWIRFNNLPNSLRRKNTRRLDCAEYRIRLLTWIIQKFGDVEISLPITQRS